MIANILTIKTIKKVMDYLNAHDKSCNFDAAEKAINGYFKQRLDGIYDNDRLFFVRFPDSVSEFCGNDDEKYQLFTDLFIAAFQQGYCAGVRDMDSLTNEMESIFNEYGNYNHSEEGSCNHAIEN